jgi:hypothetical protein
MLIASARPRPGPTGEPSGDLLPSMNWGQLETLMIDMTTGVTQKTMVRHLLQDVRQSASQVPAETTLREVLIIAAAVGAGARNREVEPC